jgi:hypothetical protein
MKEFFDAHEPPAAYQPDNLETETCWALNMFFGYLFRELKDTAPVKRCGVDVASSHGSYRWFLKMLNTDFEQIQNQTAAGKFLKRVTVSAALC